MKGSMTSRGNPSSAHPSVRAELFGGELGAAALPLVATCAFGLEAVVVDELARLGYAGRAISTGRVEFLGNARAIARTNLWLRSADRVLLRVAQFDCSTFDELFDITRSLPWETLIAPDEAFPVDGRSVRSQLTSVPAVQRTVKKAIVERLQDAHARVLLPETAGEVRAEVSLLHDIATITLDTSGDGLHKRGYRPIVGAAALKETLAAGLVQLSVWHPSRPLVDPFCGSGTIAIEAAMLARNIAPGRNRSFGCEKWSRFPVGTWEEAREEAAAAPTGELAIAIHASDIDERAIALTRRAAHEAGVERDVHCKVQPFDQLQSKREYGSIITNPPYGMRLGDDERELLALYRSMPSVFKRLPAWSFHVLTGRLDLEDIVGQQASRRRKLYNSQIECTYFTFLGPKPPRREEHAPRSEVAKPEGGAAEVAGEAEVGEAEFERAGLGKARSDLGERAGDGGDVARSGQVGLQGGDVVPHARTDDAQEDRSETEDEARSEVPDEVTDEQTNDTREEEPSETRVETDANDEPSSKPKPRVPARPMAAFGGLRERDERELAQFADRLQKNVRHLRRYPSRGITCYRVYERDCPDVPLIIDRYEGCVHVAEYEREHSRTFAQQTDWWARVVREISQACEVPEGSIFTKQKHRQKGLTQHERISDEQRTIVAQEGGLRFEVNLTDYIDTGLFLDHRLTRGMFRDQVRAFGPGCRVLNLFCYTGAFTVYAAHGGCASSVSVDLSNTYLSWTQRNLGLNGLYRKEHELVRMDVLEYLASCDASRPFDLVICDPPTFSNSKSTEEDWQVAQSQAQLFPLLRRVLAPGATVYFSNNYRRFKLDEEMLARLGFAAKEISRQTVPPEYRNERIHRCWKLRAPGPQSQPPEGSN